MSLNTQIEYINKYIHEKIPFTIKDMIEFGGYTIFDIDDKTYEYCGPDETDGVPRFKLLMLPGTFKMDLTLVTKLKF